MKKQLLISLMVFVQISGAKPIKKSWIHMHPQLYLGIGMVDIMKENPPAFITETDEDRTYQNINSLESRGIAFQYQARLNVLSVGLFSLGYSYWNHRFDYENDYPELWIRPNKLYPHRYDLSFHAVCLQSDSPVTFWKHRLQPFLLGGTGPFYGSYIEGTYAVDDINGWIWLNEKVSDEYEGWAWMAGAGLIVYRYGYVYAGVVQLNGSGLPASLFFDIVVGVRL